MIMSFLYLTVNISIYQEYKIMLEREPMENLKKKRTLRI